MTINIRELSTNELEKALEEINNELKGRMASIRINEFFEQFKKEIEFFQVTFDPNKIEENFYNDEYFHIICNLIELYDNVGFYCSECDLAKDFIFKIDEIGLDDNSMAWCLKVSYFNCVGALIEWLGYIGDIY